MLEIDQKEIERYLGYRGIHASDPEITRMIEVCKEELLQEITPSSVYQSFPIIWNENGFCSFAGILVDSRSLMRNLAGCTEVVMLAVTLGPGPDRLIRRAEVRNMLKACIYQAAGAAAVEALCDEVNEQIRKEAEADREYANILRSSGRMEKEISDMQWHILATAYVHLIFEVVRHDMTREEAAEHMQFVRDLLYPGWKQIYGL